MSHERKSKVSHYYDTVSGAVKPPEATILPRFAARRTGGDAE